MTELIFGSHLHTSRSVYVDVQTDGINDNTQLIKDAIAKAGDGGIVILKQQTNPYIVSGTIELSHSISFGGLPGERAAIKMNGTYNTYPQGGILRVNATSTSHRFNITNLILSGGTYGIEVSSSNNTNVSRGTMFDNMIFVYQHSASIMVKTGIRYTTWRNIEIDGNWSIECPLYLSAASDQLAFSTVFERCHFRESKYDGVFLSSAVQANPVLDFVDCVFESNTRTGVCLVGGKVTFSGCHFENNGSDTAYLPDIDLRYVNKRPEVHFYGGMFSTNTGSNQYLPGYTDRAVRIRVQEGKCYIFNFRPGNTTRDYIYYHTGAATTIKVDENGWPFYQDSTL